MLPKLHCVCFWMLSFVWKFYQLLLCAQMIHTVTLHLPFLTTYPVTFCHTEHRTCEYDKSHMGSGRHKDKSADTVKEVKSLYMVYPA